MYNEEQKQKFIAYAGNDYWRYLFESTADYEQEKGKDLSLLETEELLEFLIAMNSFSHAKTTRSRISKYIDWCVIKEYAAFNWIAPSVISNDFLQEVYNSSKEEFYISGEMFDVFIERLEHSSYGVYITSFFAGLYEGFDYMELANMRWKDVDKSGCIVDVDGVQRNVSETFVRLLEETYKVSEVESRSKVFRYRYSLYPDSIWKSRKANISSASMVRQFRCLLDEAKLILDEKRLTKTIIRNSGYFNKIYYMLREDGIDARELKLKRTKDGMADNRSYDKYFVDSMIDKMDMRQFCRTFQSYLKQV